jgi:hypothetical protein
MAQLAQDYVLVVFRLGFVDATSHRVHASLDASEYLDRSNTTPETNSAETEGSTCGRATDRKTGSE